MPKECGAVSDPHLVVFASAFLYAARAERGSVRTAVFSIISSNYGHYAQVLMASAQRQHPEWDRFVLTIGDLPAMHEAPFAAVPIDALALPHARQFRFRYTILEALGFLAASR